MKVTELTEYGSLSKMTQNETDEFLEEQYEEWEGKTTAEQVAEELKERQLPAGTPIAIYYPRDHLLEAYIELDEPTRAWGQFYDDNDDHDLSAHSWFFLTDSNDTWLMCGEPYLPDPIPDHDPRLPKIPDFHLAHV